MHTKIAALIGCGVGLGRAVALKFCETDYKIVGISDNQAQLLSVQDTVRHVGGTMNTYVADLADGPLVDQVFDNIRTEVGNPEVVVYHSDQWQRRSFMDLDEADLQEAWSRECLGAFRIVKQVLPAMTDSGNGTIVFLESGIAVRPKAFYSAMAVAKGSVRMLALSLADELRQVGIHVAHVNLLDRLGTSENLTPDHIADVILDIVNETEADKLTHEMDLLGGERKAEHIIRNTVFA